MSLVTPDFEMLLQNGSYSDVIKLLFPLARRTPREMTVLGIAMLRDGDLVEAEELFAIAMELGEPEARVEHANCLRAQGKYAEAEQCFDAILPELDGELRLRAQRWLGVTYAQTGRTQEALRLLETARRGYQRREDAFNAAKVSLNLAIVLNETGEKRRAVNMMYLALQVFRSKGMKNLILLSLTNLTHFLVSAKRLEGYPINLSDLQAQVAEITEQFQDSSSIKANCWRAQINLHEVFPLPEEDYLRAAECLYKHGEQFGQTENTVFGLRSKIIHLLQRNELSSAMRLIYQVKTDENGKFPEEFRILRAMINRRKGNMREAIEELKAVCSSYDRSRMMLELPRAQLQLAYALYLDDQLDDATAELKCALQGLLSTDTYAGNRSELEELSELLHFAALEPSLAPYLEPVMDSLAGVLAPTSSDSWSTTHQIRVRLQTLGTVNVTRDGQPISFLLKGTVPLLAYLTLTPDRAMSEILLDLYPDKEPRAGSAYVRKSIQELRKVLGPTSVLTLGTRNFSRYRLGRHVQVDLDLTRFFETTDQGDVVKALSLYQGEFLPGADESEWVLQRRDSARLALSFELHSRMLACKAGGDWRRLILFATQALKIDALDQGAHALRIEAAQRVATPTELGEFVAAQASR